MKKMILKTGLILSVALMCACGTKKTAVSTSIDGNWTILEVDGEKVADVEKTPEITFNTKENRVNGNAGCNNFFGSINYAGGKLKFGDDMGATRMMCKNMKFEDKALQSFPKVAKATRKGDRLLLQDESGKNLFVLEKAK